MNVLEAKAVRDARVRDATEATLGRLQRQLVETLVDNDLLREGLVAATKRLQEMESEVERLRATPAPAPDPPPAPPRATRRLRTVK